MPLDIIMSNRNQEQTTAKQHYLRDHIPQDKYEDFMDYCENFAGGNLEEEFENWDIKQLTSIVQLFFQHQYEKSLNNKKKEYQSFYAYQTGNQKELQEMREQLKKEQNQSQNNSQKQSPSTTNHKLSPKVQPKISPQAQPKTSPKEQQTALQFLDSIFDKNATTNQNESKFQTKKYDKSFFESNKFWDIPSINEPTSKIQTEASPPNNLEQKFGTNSSIIIDNDNFQKMFTSGLNIPSKSPPIKTNKQPIKTQPIQIKPSSESSQIRKTRQYNFNEIGDGEQMKKSREWNMAEIGMQKPTKSREWNMVEIGVEDETSIQCESKIESKENYNEKNKIRLKSVTNINQNKKKIAYQGQILFKKPLMTTVACFKSQQRNLSSKEIKITIQNHDIIQRSFLASNYPMFHMKVTSANNVCKRNFEDFTKLKRNLQGSYPGLRLPYLQKAGWLQSQTSPQYISRSKKYLQYFMQDILSHPELRNSRILEYFLTLKDHKSMKRKFQQYDEKIKRVSSLEELCLLDGQVPIELTEQNRQYNQMLPLLLQKINSFWDNQEKMVLQIDGLYQKMVENYKEWSEAIENIKKDVIEFNKKVNTSELLSLETTFTEMYKYANECKNFNQNEQKFIKENIQPLFRFEKQNMSMLSNLVGTQSTLTKAYIRRKVAQGSQDTLDYLSQKLKDSKESILDESKNITVLKYQCGYINHLVPKQTERYFNRLSGKISMMISDICYSKLGNLSKSTSVYSQLVIS